jgi:hypothetical protein
MEEGQDARMSRTTSNYVTVIRCDSPVCPTVGGARFMTASIATMARLQAKDARWERLPAWTITDEDSPRRKYDICPAEAPAALERKARRPEILAAQRLARKLQRGWVKQAVCLRRAERQIARRMRELAKIEKQNRRTQRNERLNAGTAVERFRAGEAVPLEDFVKEGAFPRLQPVSADTKVEGEFADDGTWRSADDPSVLAEVEATRVSEIESFPAARKPRKLRTGPTVLDVIERILRVCGEAMTVADIVSHAIGDLALPTTSKTPKTIVARDLALDIRADARGSRFVRTAPGMFMLRDHWVAIASAKEVAGG